MQVRELGVGRERESGPREPAIPNVAGAECEHQQPRWDYVMGEGMVDGQGKGDGHS